MRFCAFLLIAFALHATVVAAKAETEAEKLIAKAKLGSVEAQLELGDAYRGSPYGGDSSLKMSDGSQVKQNYDEAEHWLKQAAKTSLLAKARLGGLYSSDDFPRRNDAAAAHLFGEVARSPDADKDLLMSVEYALGYILYQTCTGYLISFDCGPNKSSPIQNYQAAAHWFKKAAEQGHPQAQFELATMYEGGKGVAQDFTESAKWYEAAYKGRHEEAAIMLGDLYVRTDRLPTAYMWYNLASTQNRYQGGERRDELSKRLSAAQVEEGQKMTREYLASTTEKKTCTWYRC